MTAAHQMLDLDAISVHEHSREALNGLRTGVMSNDVLKQAGQLAQMAYDLMAGMLRLEVVEFSSVPMPIDYFHPDWRFETSRDGQGRTLEVSSFSYGSCTLRRFGR
jgi:hypothetical protein